MTPVEIIATVTVLSVIVKAVVDAIRRGAPVVDGLGAQLLAWLLGVFVAWTIDLRATLALLEAAGGGAGRIPPAFADYLITGAAIAAGAGAIAELVGRSGSDLAIVEVDEHGDPL